MGAKRNNHEMQNKINEFMNEISRIHYQGNINIGHIYNMNQTGIYWDMPPTRTVVEKTRLEIEYVPQTPKKIEFQYY